MSELLPTCQKCGSVLPRPAETCHCDPCPSCGYPRPNGDCSDRGPRIR